MEWNHLPGNYKIMACDRVRESENCDVSNTLLRFGAFRHMAVYGESSTSSPHHDKLINVMEEY